MRAYLRRAISFAALLFSLASCTRKTEELQLEKTSDYFNLQPGKYIIYRTDSTVFTNFNLNTEIHSYQEKQVVDAQVTDNLGNTSYRIFRYMRDTAGLQPWVPTGTLLITTLQQSVEVVENNLRYVKLAEPLSLNGRWRGNNYLPTEPYRGVYQFNNDDAMSSWTYQIIGIHETLTLNGQTVPDVLTVREVDEAYNVPITPQTVYAARNYAVDKYAKGIGLVYQEYIMWEYQGQTGGNTTNGFGVKRSMIQHN